MNTYRSTCAKISAKALQHNFDWLSKQLNTGELLPIIKADAYGHNAAFVAEQLNGVAKLFAVAIMEEAEALRNAGANSPLVILEGVYTEAAFRRCNEINCIPVLHCKEQVNAYQQVAKLQRPKCWVKVDIGMNRLGFPYAEVANIWPKIIAMAPEAPILIGHFSSADSLTSSETESQLTRFMALKTQFNCQSSLTNSPAVVNWPNSHNEWNRAGIALYGISASDYKNRCIELQPVMTLVAPILTIRHINKGECVGYGGSWQAKRDSIIATVAIGYADGYPRHASNGAPVWVKGKRAPVVGKVSMDMISIDITECETIHIGEEVELWGKHLPVEQVAAHCNTIAYELVTRVGPRVPRMFY